jgi:hypothetical protein
MPNRKVDLLFHFLNQNSGTLSRRAREREFVKLTDDETTQIEKFYEEMLGDS